MNPSLIRRQREVGCKMKGPMDMVVLRIDKSLSYMATIALLGMIRAMSTLDLLALGVVRTCGYALGR